MKFLFFSLFWVSFASIEDGVKKEGIEYLESLSKTREALAQTLDGRKDEITEKDFKQVCVPVGMSLKRWADEKGYRAKQVSLKYRNPLHSPSEQEELMLKEFSADSQKRFLTKGNHLFVRIDTVKACLHCHGAEASRPDFIKAKYKRDKAFDFKAGDLRGMYSVFIPTKSQGQSR